MRILIVEDEPAVALSLKRVFQKNDFDPEHFPSAIAAISALSENTENIHDVGLIDLYMPEVSGYDMIQWLNTHRPKTKVIAMSAISDAHLQDQLASPNLIGFITKPFDDIFAVPKKVQQFLQNAKSQPAKDQN